MKYLGKKQAFKKLHAIQTEFAEEIRGEFEHLAKSCVTCETPGACCLDAHFVNVHISPLEAAAIRERLNTLPDEQKREVYGRIERVI